MFIIADSSQEVEMIQMPIDSRKDKKSMLYICMEYYLSLKRNAVVIQAKTGWTSKTLCGWKKPDKISGRDKSIQKASQVAVTWGWRWEVRVTANGNRDAFEAKECSEPGFSDDCSTLYIHESHLTVPLKQGNFICKLYLNKAAAVGFFFLRKACSLFKAIWKHFIFHLLEVICNIY